MLIILGDLRHSIDVTAKAITKDDFGAESITWNTLYTNLRASVKYGKGFKDVQEHEIFPKQFLIFSTHYRNISTENRIVWKGKRYIINIVEEIGFKEGLNIHCDLLND